MKLKSKYILLTVITLVFTIGIVSYQNLRLQEHEIFEDEKEKAVFITNLIKHGLSTMMLKGRAKEFQNFIETLHTGDIKQAVLFKPDGTIISSSHPSQIGSRISSSYLSRFQNSQTHEIVTGTKKGETNISLIVPILNEKPCQRCHVDSEKVRAVFSVEFSTSRIVQKIEITRKRTILLSVISIIVISLLLGTFTEYFVNKPITSIISTMKKAEAGDLSVKFLTRRRDEIGKLASSLNSMLFKLDKAQREIKQWHFSEMQNIEKMATIGEVASSVAHEIRNPLAGISGAIQVLAEDMSAKDPRKTIINEVLSEINRLDHAVRDLLVFARPPEPHPIITPLDTIIERTLHMAEQQSQKQGVAIQIRKSDTEMKVFVDPEQIHQVFLNIVLNSLQSMPGGGTLTIGTYIRPEINEAEISFTDTGFGIRKDALKNIFKPFFTTRSTGTGLGLAISRAIIERHGGRITVESSEGIGSTFHVFLKMFHS